MRYRPDETPVEQRSFAGFFFLLGVVSVLIAGWVLFNEFQTRRPWKRFQSDFYRLERLRIESNIAELEARLRALGIDPNRIEEIVALDTSLSPAEVDALARQTLEKTYKTVDDFNHAWAKVLVGERNGVPFFQRVPRNFSDVEWRNTLTLVDLQRMYDEEDGKLRVQRSLRDAEYYRYLVEKEASSEKRRFETAVAFMDKRIAARDAVIAELDAVTREMREWLGNFQRVKGEAQAKRQTEGLHGYSGEAITLAKALDEERKQLRLVRYNLLEFLRNFGEAKRPRIQQVILGEVAHTTNNVDRCMTCHIAATRPGYQWWIAEAASVLENGTLVKALPDEKRPGAFVPDPNRPVGNTLEWILSRPVQKGRFWNEPVLYINGVRYYPSDGFTVSGWRVRWNRDFVSKYLAVGATLEIYQAYPKLYQSHPNREALFTAHPSEKFGCITCHNGQGRALTWKDAGCDFRENPTNPNSPMFYWEAPVLASLKPDGGLIERAKIALQTRAIQDIARYLNIPVEEVRWHEATYGTDVKYRNDSHFHPKVNGEPIGNFAEANCRHCHNETLELDYAPTLSKAKRLFEKLGCHGCHFVADYERIPYDPAKDYVAYRRAQVGPSLTWDAKLAQMVRSDPGVPNRGIGWKLSRTTGKQWMFNWLKDPRSYLHDTRMPNYRFSDEEAKALTAFLLKTTGWEEGAQPTPMAQASRQGNAVLVAVTTPSSTGEIPIDPKNVKEGELLIKNIGCLACHQIVDSETGQLRGNTFGPNLSRVGSKVRRDFLEQWLENPRVYDPKTVMPSMFDNVPPAERQRQIRAIVDYLLAQNDTSWMKYQADFELTPELVAKGEQLFGPSGKGCGGCHFFEADVPDGKGGVRHVGGQAWVGQQIGPELSDFGIKKPEVLDYGFARHRTIAYYGDRSRLLWGEVVRTNKDGSLVLRVPKNQEDPHAAKGFFYRRPEELTEITLPPDVPRTVTKVEHTWHDWAFNKIKEPNLFATEVNAIAQNMPNFYLSDDEAAALLVLLRSFSGKSHVPPAYQKTLSERERRIERGRDLVIRYNCVGCHVIEESFVTRDGRLIKGWEIGKHSRDDEALPTYPGPDGVLGTEDDIRANGWAVPASSFGTTVNIRPSYDPSRPKEEVQKTTLPFPSEAIVSRNPKGTAVGFQSVGSPLSFMRAGYEVEVGGRQVRIQHGPVLTFAGKRFRPDWLVEFLRRPYPVRRYLFERNQGRMPYFHLSDEEIADLVAYFMALVDEPYPYQTVEVEVNPDLIAIGREMFRNEAQCASGACHPNPGTTPLPSNLAPNLVSTSRLKPQWVKEWIANPEAFWPGNGMPYFPWEANGTPLYPAYANGDVNIQMEALRDYVLSLGRKMSRTAP